MQIAKAEGRNPTYCGDNDSLFNENPERWLSPNMNVGDFCLSDLSENQKLYTLPE